MNKTPVLDVYIISAGMTSGRRRVSSRGTGYLPHVNFSYTPRRYGITPVSDRYRYSIVSAGSSAFEDTGWLHCIIYVLCGVYPRMVTGKRLFQHKKGIALHPGYRVYELLMFEVVEIAIVRTSCPPTNVAQDKTNTTNKKPRKIYEHVRTDPQDGH